LSASVAEPISKRDDRYLLLGVEAEVEGRLEGMAIDVRKL
jgi:hypothetical protein